MCSYYGSGLSGYDDNEIQSFYLEIIYQFGVLGLVRYNSNVFLYLVHVRAIIQLTSTGRLNTVSMVKANS